MNYKEEIEKLQARVKRLEQQLPTESLISCSPVESNLKIAKLTQAELEKLKPLHEFKVGDRVQFKTWEELEEEFESELAGNETEEICLSDKVTLFIFDMKYLCGTYATILRFLKDGGALLKDFSKKNKDNHLWAYSLDVLKPVTTEHRWSFTEDEKTILRNVDEEYKWLARDENNSLYAYENKPTKNLLWTNWEDNFVNMGYWEFGNFEELFQCIKWSDDEPCEFRKFL